MRNEFPLRRKTSEKSGTSASQCKPFDPTAPISTATLGGAPNSNTPLADQPACICGLRRLIVWIISLTIVWLDYVAPVAWADECVPVPCRVLVVAFVGGLGTASFPPSVAASVLNDVHALGYPDVCIKPVSTYWPWTAPRWVHRQFTAARKACSTTTQTTRDSQAQPHDLTPKIDERTRIIVFGYSLGGPCALRFARTMQREGISIDLLVTVDTKGFTKGIVPANVKKAANYYERWLYPFFYPLYYGKRDIRAEEPASTDFLGNIQVQHAGHFTIASVNPVRQLLLEAVRGAHESFDEVVEDRLDDR